eukprot:4530903-Pyramimonas_sp.AAC.1
MMTKATTGNIDKMTMNTETTTATSTAEREEARFRRGTYYGDQQNNKGRGKQASGSLCTECGAKWHSSEQCPMKTNSGPGGSSSQPDEGGHVNTERPQDEEEYGNRKGSWRPSLRGSRGKGYDRRPQTT